MNLTTLSKSQLDRLDIFNDRLADVVNPPKKISTLEWFEENMYMPAEKSMGGKISAYSTPVMAQVLNLYDNPKYDVIYVMAGARSGKTLSTLAYIGREITTTKRQIIDAWPNDLLIRRQLKVDFADMVRSSPIFEPLIGTENEDKKAGNYKQKRYKNGSNLFMVNMQSSNDMSGVDAPIMIIHELDRAPRTTGNDGSVEGQLFARQQAQFRKKAIIESTPTYENSPIHEGYMNGTQHVGHFFFPCCNEWYPIEWSVTVDGGKAGVVWTNNEDSTVDYSSARYCCKGCGTLHTDEDIKNIVFAKGEHSCRLIPTYPERTTASVHAGWLLTGPYGKMTELVKDYVIAEKQGPESMRAFYNLKLGQPYTIPGSKIDYQSLMDRSIMALPLVVPIGAVMLTAGVDVQKYYLAVQIVAWSDNERRQVIYYSHINGDTSTDEPWNKLFILMDSEIDTAYGQGKYNIKMPIEAVCVDTGGVDTHFYYSKLRNKGPRYIAIKGSNNFNCPIYKKPRFQDVRYDGKVIEKGIELFECGVSQAKIYLYNQFSTSKTQTDRGYTTFGSFLGPAYYKELASEQLVVTPDKKGDKYIYSFEKITDRNEALDTFIYSFVAYVMTAGHSCEYLDYNHRLSLLMSNKELDGTNVEHNVVASTTKATIAMLDNERIPCQILKDKVYIVSEKKHMSAGDIVDLSLEHFKEYVKIGVVAPIGATDKILKIQASIEESLKLKEFEAKQAVQHMPTKQQPNHWWKR